MTHTNHQWKRLALESFIEIAQAPYATFESIGKLYNTLNDVESVKQMIDYLSRYDQAKQAFQKRPAVGEIDLQYLHRLPEQTLGYQYADHIVRNAIAPVHLPVAESEHSYLLTHIVETHDIWHVVTGFDTSMAGEIALQTFVAAQLHASRFSLAMLAKNLLKTAIEEIELAEQRLDALTEGWIAGKQAACLVGIEWNLLWETPLNQLRIQLNLK